MPAAGSAAQTYPAFVGAIAPAVRREARPRMERPRAASKTNYRAIRESWYVNEQPINALTSIGCNVKLKGHFGPAAEYYGGGSCVFPNFSLFYVCVVPTARIDADVIIADIDLRKTRRELLIAAKH